MGSIIGHLFNQASLGICRAFGPSALNMVYSIGRGVNQTVHRTMDFFGLGAEEIPPESRYMYGVVGMLAKMAKADGHVDATEIRLMQELLKTWGLKGDDLQTFKNVFNELKDDDTDIAELAEIAIVASAEMSPDDEGLDFRIDAYRYLFLMALADENLDDSEIAILRTIPDPLGLKDEVFEWMASELLEDGPEGDAKAALGEAYRILGVDADASDAQVRSAYKRKIAKFHPDKIQGEDLDSEWMELANAKCAEINEAYNIVRNARKLGKPAREAKAPGAQNTRRRGRKPHVLREECVDLSQIPGLPTPDSEGDSLTYACPHCKKRFSVPEDSEEYLVACPGCGKQLDLTELNPL